MKQRLFVAINLPEDLKKKIGQIAESLQKSFDFPARFLDSSNWHLTLSFLGYQNELIIDAINGAIRKTTASCEPPLIELESITYGPPEKGAGGPKNPRMIWLNGSRQTSQRLDVIKKSLENNLIDAGINFRVENRQFQAHVTLMRFETALTGALPKINNQFKQRFTSTSMDLMASKLGRSGARYSLLASFDFTEPA